VLVGAPGAGPDPVTPFAIAAGPFGLRPCNLLLRACRENCVIICPSALQTSISTSSSVVGASDDVSGLGESMLDAPSTMAPRAR